MVGLIAPLPIEVQNSRFKNNILLHISGVGASRARASAESLIKKGVEALVSWGTAGGLSPAAQPGQLILPDKILDSHGRIFKTDASWKNQIQKMLDKKIRVHDGALLQAAQMIHSVSEKQALFAQYGAVAVDMESAAVAETAQQAGLPFIAVRAITDSSRMALPHWLSQTLDASGALRPWHFMQQFCRHPESWISLYRLSRGFSAAKKTLSAVSQRISLN